MKLFVTVGTTPFDSLVEAVDGGPYAHDAQLQIADGQYEPKVAQWFRFRPGIQELIASADVVVCHAGAGSIYSLLEAGIVPVVVPNTERRDQHQLEIARWLARMRYAVVAMKPENINDVLDGYQQAREDCVAFSEQRFFYQDELNQVLRTHLGLGDQTDKGRDTDGGKQ